MAKILKNKNFISLDSVQTNLNVVNENLVNQSIKMGVLLDLTQKLIHQQRIQNMYKAHENDFIIDDNIFENDEIN